MPVRAVETMTASTMMFLSGFEGSGRPGVELLQVRLDVRREARMVDQPVEMSRCVPELLTPLLLKDGDKAALAERRPVKPFVEEQAELGHEAYVRQRQRLADQESAVGLQGLVDARGPDRECFRGAGVDVGRELRIAQGKQVDLRIPGKNQAGVQEAVDA